jgi:hypothetical protein
LEGTHAPDEVYAEVRDQFSEEELVELTVAIGLINTWNRLRDRLPLHSSGRRGQGGVTASKGEPDHVA